MKTAVKIKSVKNMENVLQLFQELKAEDVEFHPDENFNNYVNRRTDTPSYTKPEARLRNRLMREAFAVCAAAGVDIYAFGMRAIGRAAELGEARAHVAHAAGHRGLRPRGGRAGRRL